MKISPQRILKKVSGLYEIFLLQCGYDINSGRRIKKEKTVKLGSPKAAWSIVPFQNQELKCLLVGAGEDISFDIALAKRFKGEIFIFDPTPRAIDYCNNTLKNLDQEVAKKITFFPHGVWSEDTNIKFYTPENKDHISHSILNLQKTGDYFTAQVKTLKTICTELSIDQIDILKLDIEGAEYEVLKSIKLLNVPIKQICVEFDELFNPLDQHYKSRIKEAIDRLYQLGYRIAQVDYPGNYTFLHEDYH